ESPQWLPASAEGLIGARIDRLELAVKVVLQRVSLLETPFSAAQAGLVLDQPPVDALDELVRLDLLERADVRLDTVSASWDVDTVPVEQRLYRFCNALTREVAQRNLVPEQARALHRRIAEHLVEQ